MKGGIIENNQSILEEESGIFNPIFFQQVFDALHDGVFFVDTDLKILYWNRGAEMLTGYSHAEVIGSYYSSGLFDHIDGAGRRLCESNCPLTKAIKNRQIQSRRIYFRHKDRRDIAVSMQALPIKNEQDEIVGAAGIIRDATMCIALEDAYGQLHTLLEKDDLTGAVSRRQTEKTIKEQLELLKRSGIVFSLIFFRIDNLKKIKTHADPMAAVRAQILISNLLQRQCRGVDVVGRHKEGKFIIILRQQKLDGAREIADRLRIAVLASIPESLFHRNITASLGVTEATIDDTPESLLKRAAIALHHARRDGGNKVDWIDPTMEWLASKPLPI